MIIINLCFIYIFTRIFFHYAGNFNNFKSHEYQDKEIYLIFIQFKIK